MLIKILALIGVVVVGLIVGLLLRWTGEALRAWDRDRR